MGGAETARPPQNGSYLSSGADSPCGKIAPQGAIHACIWGGGGGQNEI